MPLMSGGKARGICTIVPMIDEIGSDDRARRYARGTPSTVTMASETVAQLTDTHSAGKSPGTWNPRWGDVIRRMTKAMRGEPKYTTSKPPNQMRGPFWTLENVTVK